LVVVSAFASGASGEDFTIQTFAGGALPENVQGTSAVLHLPSGVVADANGNVFFGASPSIILKLDSNGILTRVAGTGTAGFSGDGGLAVNAQLTGGGTIAMDATGNLYILDNDRIRKIQNGIISTIAGGGTGTGDNIPALDALLKNISGLAVDAAGNVYFDTLDCSQVQIGSHNCIGAIRKISNGIVTTIAGNGTWGYSGDGGPATSAQLAGPGIIAIDGADTLYFNDFGLKNNGGALLSYSHIRKIQNGIISTVTNVASLLTVDQAGNLYVIDESHNSIQKISNGVMTTIAGKEYIVGQSFGENGPALDAILGGLAGITVDKAGNVFITSSGQSTTIPPSFDVLRKISNGMITTVAGGALGALASIGDNGPPAGAQLYFFKGRSEYLTSGNVAMDAAGNVYIVEFNRIRKISQGVITTVAGTGLAGFSGDGGPATEALLNDPWGIGLDAAGNLYIADQGNLRVREVSNGIINTIAGSGTLGFSGDGGLAINAKMGVGGLAVSPGGDVYVSDPYYRQVVRKISNGIITTVSGLGTNYGESIPAASSGLSQPTGLALDGAGNLYVAESFFQRVRKISSGIITTIAGYGAPAATSASVSFPTALAVDSLGRVYIGEGTIVQRWANGTISTMAGNTFYGFSGDGGPATNAMISNVGLAIGPNGQVYEADLLPWRVRVLTPVPVPGLSFSATPVAVNTGSALGLTTLNWSAPGYTSLQIYANGSLFANVGTSGSLATGNWVNDGMNFSLVDPETGAPLSTVTVHTGAVATRGPIVLTASPNPITLAPGVNVGESTLNWNAPGYSALQIRVSGVLFAAGLPESGSIDTGNWVSDGLSFSLVDPASGQTIASVTVAAK